MRQFESLLFVSLFLDVHLLCHSSIAPSSKYAVIIDRFPVASFCVNRQAVGVDLANVIVSFWRWRKCATYPFVAVVLVQSASLPARRGVARRAGR